jgi:hypothetical protein
LASVSLCFRFRNVAYDTCLKLHVYLSGRKQLCLTYLFSITCISIYFIKIKHWVLW